MQLSENYQQIRNFADGVSAKKDSLATETSAVFDNILDKIMSAVRQTDATDAARVNDSVNKICVKRRSETGGSKSAVQKRDRNPAEENKASPVGSEGSVSSRSGRVRHGAEGAVAADKRKISAAVTEKASDLKDQRYETSAVGCRAEKADNSGVSKRTDAGACGSMDEGLESSLNKDELSTGSRENPDSLNLSEFSESAGVSESRIRCSSGSEQHSDDSVEAPAPDNQISVSDGGESNLSSDLDPEYIQVQPAGSLSADDGVRSSDSESVPPEEPKSGIAGGNAGYASAEHNLVRANYPDGMYSNENSAESDVSSAVRVQSSEASVEIAENVKNSYLKNTGVQSTDAGIQTGKEISESPYAGIQTGKDISESVPAGIQTGKEISGSVPAGIETGEVNSSNSEVFVKNESYAQSRTSAGVEVENLTAGREEPVSPAVLQDDAVWRAVRTDKSEELRISESVRSVRTENIQDSHTDGRAPGAESVRIADAEESEIFVAPEQDDRSVSNRIYRAENVRETVLQHVSRVRTAGFRSDHAGSPNIKNDLRISAADISAAPVPDESGDGEGFDFDAHVSGVNSGLVSASANPDRKLKTEYSFVRFQNRLDNLNAGSDQAEDPAEDPEWNYYAQDEVPLERAAENEELMDILRTSRGVSARVSSNVSVQMSANQVNTAVNAVQGSGSQADDSLSEHIRIGADTSVTFSETLHAMAQSRAEYAASSVREETADFSKSGEQSDYIGTELSASGVVRQTAASDFSSSAGEHGGADRGAEQIYQLHSVSGIRSGHHQKESGDVVQQLQKTVHLSRNYEENARQVAEKLNIMLSRNVREAEINLDPTGLGKMKITVNMSDDAIARVSMIVQQSETRELVSDSLSRLRFLLGQQGISLGESSVEQQNSWGGRSQNEGSSATKEFTSDKISGGDADDADFTAGGVRMVEVSDREVDYYA